MGGKCLQAFVKVYEHENNNKSSNIAALMCEILPILLSSMTTLVVDKSDESRILQVLILKAGPLISLCIVPLPWGISQHPTVK